MTAITRLNPHDANAKTSIAFAFDQGYTFTPDGDGSACVTTPDGEHYHIYNWECDCPDAICRMGGSYELPDKRQMCKHVLWLAQLYPCTCGASMTLIELDRWRMYMCTTCGALKPFQEVKVERQQTYRQREQEADVVKTVNANPPAEPAVVTQRFNSRYGINYYAQNGHWIVTMCGSQDSTHAIESEAHDQAERLELLEEAHHTRYGTDGLD